MNAEGEFLRHEPCTKCGSSDGKAIYSSGTAYCFVCSTYYPSTDSEGVQQQPQRRKGMITEIDYRPLNKRRISLESCRKYGYGYGTLKGKTVHLAPYYFKNQLVAQHIRTASKDFSWTGEAKQLELFGQHLWEIGGKRLVITEGEIDCMSVAQAFSLRWPVVSVPNGAQSAAKYIKQNIEFIESYDEVVFAFDNDEFGREAAEKCAQLLTPGKAKIANWSPYKDANEMLQDGKGSQIASIIFSAQIYRPDGIIIGSELTLDYLLKDEDIMAYDIPYSLLNAKLKGLRKAEITTLTAGSGVGKSTLAREIAYHLMGNHNLNIGYVALEESVKKSALGFMAMKLDVPLGDLFLNKKIVSEELFDKAYQEIIASNKLYLYDHFGSLDSDNLVSKLKYLAIGCGVDFIVLDHISIVVSGIEDGDERRIIDNLMTNLRSLAENTGVGLILISHLRVPQGSKAHEEGGRVTMNQLRDSGSIKQLSDNIVGVERDQQGENPNESNLRLLKTGSLVLLV